MAQVRQSLDSNESKNLFYAIRIEGEFEYVKTRSVPKQSKPYKKLTEVVNTQPTFEMKAVKGTIIGFCCPYYVKGINVPGCHLHFLTADRTHGGHVLDFIIKNASLNIDVTPGFYLSLPTSSEFSKADFQGTSQKDVEKVEKDNK